MNFYETEIAPVKRRIEGYLRGGQFQDAVKRAAGKQAAGYVPALADACTGGKCLRGYLVALGYFAAAGEELPDIRPAAAFEVFQGGILAHDDVIDESPLRRGKPSAYLSLGGGHDGISRAICLGDLCIALSVALIARSEFEETRKAHALRLFSEVVARTVVGEMADIDLSRENAGEEEILAMYEGKTAHYSVAGPLAVGAALGGGGEALIGALQAFGVELGVAFQIRDDIAGVFSTEGETGKSLTDAEEGKSTLLTAYFSRTAKARAEFFSLYGKKDLSQEQQARIRTLLKEAGADVYAARAAEERERRAEELARALPAPAGEKLAALCKYLSKKK